MNLKTPAKMSTHKIWSADWKSRDNLIMVHAEIRPLFPSDPTSKNFYYLSWAYAAPNREYHSYHYHFGSCDPTYEKMDNKFFNIFNALNHKGLEHVIRLMEIIPEWEEYI